MSVTLEPASFRDPSGCVFYLNSKLYRRVDHRYSENYDLLIGSGLYDALVQSGLLVPHIEANVDDPIAAGAYRIIEPDRLPFISYPYEWSFSQLKDAALATLRIHKRALQSGMSLKDANAYNIQFHAGKPLLIDTLSFEKYEEGVPWIAYRQFCQHFLAPLALMSKTDIRLGRMLRPNLDGIPLDLASRLLPWKTKFNTGLLAHIHIHGAAQKRYESSGESKSSRPASVSRTAHLGLIDNLETTVEALTWLPDGTEWANYYTNTNYSDAAMTGKLALVSQFFQRIEPRPNVTWDLGANTGVFSRLTAKAGSYTVAWDMDPAAVERCYLEVKRDNVTHMLPLVGDLTNPSPGLGWAHMERRSMSGRSPVDLILALALVHHLAIGNNVPLERIASYFSGLCSWLIIEFVPKGDSQVDRLLSSREDIFDRYTQSDFEAEFDQYFELIHFEPVTDSRRTLYLMRSRKS